MFNKLFSLFTGKSTTDRDNRRLAEKLNDSHLLSVREKGADGVECIIGRDCHVNLTEKGVLTVTEGVKTLLRADVSQMKAWEFMSLDGCVITFTDLDTGTERTVTLYYDKYLEKH